jgi:hypothetical protein
MVPIKYAQQYTNMANPSLDGTTRNHLKELLDKPKVTKSFSWALSLKCFHNYKLLFFHVYLLHALIYGLKYTLEVKKRNC